MNILFYYSNAIVPEQGGVQRVTKILADFFTKKGNVTFYLSRRRKEGADLARQFFLPVSSFANNAKNMEYLGRLLKHEQIDLIINQDGLSPDDSALIYHATKYHVKIISVLHNSPLAKIKNYESSGLLSDRFFLIKYFSKICPTSFIRCVLLILYKQRYKKHFRKLCLRCDKVVLLSEKFKDEIKFFLTSSNCYKDKIMAIPNPTNLMPTTSFLENKLKEVLYVGRIDCSQKRLDLLLKIWRKIENEFPTWRLTIVGSGDLDSVQKLARRLGLQRVFFEGIQSPELYYARAAIFCMTSSYEGFPLTLSEAMSAKCIPIAFDSFLSVRDIIDTGVNGFLIPPFDCDTYALVLSSLMRNDNQRALVATAANKKAMQFSISEIGKKWENLSASL